MKYSIGIDFGSLSGRCVLTRLEDGMIVATSVSEYKHGVMDEFLWDGEKLPIDWALQDPHDYLDVLTETIPAVLQKAHVDGGDIVGIGVDFTSCTVLPIDKNGVPLCFKEEFIHRPHAYVKLWKHHAAQPEADLINSIASDRQEPFLKRYGGKISSEWLFPKLLQIFREDKQIYNSMDCFIEAVDWIVFKLSGQLTRNESALGYKAIWEKGEGFPSEDFFAQLSPGFKNVIREKIKGRIVPTATKVGTIVPELADVLGLSKSVCICSGHLDAACSLIGAGINVPGSMLAVMGTSTCHMLLGEGEKYVPGICGCVYGGCNPGFMGYEAGQSCVGDHFQWIAQNCIPESYSNEAKRRGISIFKYLAELNKNTKVGENGLLALDWWNGNRSILVDGKLSGMLLGCTLQTKPEDIYRALVEATAFGTKIIIDNFVSHGVPVKTLYCSGGIARKDSFVMQIYADVLGMTVHIVESKENAALSASILGAVAGSDNFGYPSLSIAISNMSQKKGFEYQPNLGNNKIYQSLFEEYCKLYKYFGKGENTVMKKLKSVADMQRR